jgi:DNA-binding NarL/FixJ family response regulator
MRPVRVLLGSLPARLRDDLSQAISSEPDLDVVGVVSRPTTLLLAAGRLRADVVVVAMFDQGFPGIASHLLDQYPQIWVVAVTIDGRQALAATTRPHTEQIALTSLADLVRTIRSLGDEA